MNKIKIIFSSIALSIIVTLPACDKRGANYDGLKTVIPYSDSSGVITRYPMTGETDYYIAGMRYKIFASSSGNIFVVNITKDSLEVSKAK